MKQTGTLTKSVKARRVTALLVLGCMLQNCHAQYRDFDIVRDSSAWLTVSNAAGLVRYGEGSITKAELSTQMARGRFVNFDDSPKSTDLNASIESFFRISPSTTVYGRMSYNSFSGHEMGGSAFIPSVSLPAFPLSRLPVAFPRTIHRPFDIIEDSLTNLGRTHGDSYQLTGSIGTDLYHGIAIGAAIDYTAANFAKYKDLRHSNKLSDMTMTVGTLIPATRWLSFGADVYYRRNIESLNFSLFGRDDKVYKSLIDYSVMTGRIEQFGNYGFTNNYYEMPLLDEHKGFGLQMEIAPSNSRISLFSSFHYAHRNGYYGKHSPYTITYTGHSSDIYEYAGRLTLKANATKHFLTLHINAELLNNRLNSYRELKSEAGSTFYEYYTPVKTGDKSWVEGDLSYTLYVNTRHNSPITLYPSYIVHASYHWLHRKQTAYAYPFLRHQHLNNSLFTFDISRNVQIHSSLLSINMNGSFLQGWGTPCLDKTFIQPSDKQTPPPSMEYYLLREHRYLTAPQYTIGCGAKYALYNITWLKGYPSVAISILHKKCNAPHALSPLLASDGGHAFPDFSSERDHTTVTFTIGYSF